MYVFQKLKYIYIVYVCIKATQKNKLYIKKKTSIIKSFFNVNNSSYLSLKEAGLSGVFELLYQ